MDVTLLPALNASLNALCTVLLVTGFVLIRRGRREAHRRVMLSAFATSVVFLVSYLYYHSQTGSTGFVGQGSVRVLYFSILISHTVLAAAVPVLASITLVRGLRERFERHVAIARWTLPIWLYVSVTGVAVYLMLYQMDWGG